MVSSQLIMNAVMLSSDQMPLHSVSGGCMRAVVVIPQTHSPAFPGSTPPAAGAWLVSWRCCPGLQPGCSLPYGSFLPPSAGWLPCLCCWQAADPSVISSMAQTASFPIGLTFNTLSGSQICMHMVYRSMHKKCRLRTPATKGQGQCCQASIACLMPMRR